MFCHICSHACVLSLCLHTHTHTHTRLSICRAEMIDQVSFLAWLVPGVPPLPGVVYHSYSGSSFTLTSEVLTIGMYFLHAYTKKNHFVTPRILHFSHSKVTGLSSPTLWWLPCGTFYSDFTLILYVMCSDHTEVTAFPCEFPWPYLPLLPVWPIRGFSGYPIDLPLSMLSSSPWMTWQPLEPAWNTFFCPVKVSATLENIAFLTVAWDPSFVQLCCFCSDADLVWTSAQLFTFDTLALL